MKRRGFYGLICLLLVCILIMPSGVSAEEKEVLDLETTNPFFDVDNEKREIYNFSAGTTLEGFISFFKGAQNEIEVNISAYKDKTKISGEDLIKKGMTVEINLDGKNYGVYQIGSLNKVTVTTKSANGYGFISPLPGINCLSHVTQNWKGSAHHGIDISWGGCAGHPIVSVKNGTVEKAVFQSSWGYYVRINHGSETTLYAHMQQNSIMVSAGQSVSQGQQIGRVGTTGNSTGNHLHLEVWPGGVRSSNPRPYLTGAGDLETPPDPDPTPEEPPANYEKSVALSGDFNGDGMADAAYYIDLGSGVSKIQTALSTGSGFVKEGLWEDRYNNFEYSRVEGRTVSGDFNGDGKDDIAGLYDYGNGRTTVQVFTSNGSSFQWPVNWFDTGSGNFEAYRVTGRVVAGDFNGDGKDDIATLYDYGDGRMKTITFISNGSSFIYGDAWFDTGRGNFEAYRVTGRVVAGDFNGDGKDDIATLYDYGNGRMKTITFISNGSSFIYGDVWHDSGTGNFETARATGRVVAGDFNGDQKDDLATYYDYGNGQTKILVSTSNGSIFSYFNSWHDSGAGNFEAARVTGRVLSGDFNGDGVDDIGSLYYYSATKTSAFVSLSNGNSFNWGNVWLDNMLN